MITPPKNLTLPEWNEGDGPTAYVYDRAPRGHRCAWACRYLVPAGSVNLAEERGGQAVTLQRFVEVGTGEWQGIEPYDMDEAQILAELWDSVDRGENVTEAYAQIRDIEERGIQATRIATGKLLQRVRRNYPVYVLPWQKPAPELVRGAQPMEKPYRGIYDDALEKAFERSLVK